MPQSAVAIPPPGRQKVVGQGRHHASLEEVLREGGVLLIFGLVLGVTGAMMAAQAVEGLLFGVAPHDPVTFIVVALMMAVVGITACWVPALRAARVDPAATMRSS